MISVNTPAPDFFVGAERNERSDENKNIDFVRAFQAVAIEAASRGEGLDHSLRRFVPMLEALSAREAASAAVVPSTQLYRWIHMMGTALG